MHIKINQLSKRFGNNLVLDDINLDIPSESFTTLLGPSGCGKTTLLRIIAGLETADQGEIYFDDVCVFSAEDGINLPAEKREIGFVFQDFALWPHLTVYENVAFGLRATNQTQHLEAKVMQALERIQLQDFAQSKPGNLSGGQQQRVAFARAIATEPKLILFDEPFSALDAILREGMRFELKQLANDYAFTSVFVTHDQLEAMTMSDRIAVLSTGELEQFDSPENIYASPKTKFVAKFVGESNWLNHKAMFRPEHSELQLKAIENGLEAQVIGSEFLGSIYKLHLTHKNHSWTYMSPRRYETGDIVYFTIPEENIIHIEKGA